MSHSYCNPLKHRSHEQVLVSVHQRQDQGLDVLWKMVIVLLTCVLISLPISADSTGSTLPNIYILGTGGTIAGTGSSETDLTDYTAGVLDIDSLIASVPELPLYANLTGEQICDIDSSQMTPEIWLNLSRRINELVQDPAIDGVVVTHGTDTMEETAYFLNLVVKSEKPVVMTGSMRPSTALSADGPLNLLDAVILAGSPEALGKGVLILLNSQINGARETTKTNTEMVGTFRSPDFGLFGYMDGTTPRLYRQSLKNHTTASEFDVSGLSHLPRVDIVYLYPGMDQTAIDAFIAHKTEGFVIASLGNGGMPDSVHSALLKAVDKGIPVVVSSRTGTGVCTTEESRFISADSLNPQKARVLLMLALTQTQDPEEIARMFRIY
ncbi:asparaginase [Methanospirillum hungatei]|uniref:asparaginase n=1 Tax=Methanospirillum hungatei TaxID=2203 RepID=UPI0026EC5EC9|nr:asparaginase [Methanospirillum hungatei]MCA1915182.1 asparaginase [Methanospirillum hungatei]